MFFKCIWKHDDPDDPVLLYSELDAARWEVRKIEVFRDGSLCWADHDGGTGTTRLGDQPLPTLEAIAAQPEFEPEEIASEEFEEVWSRALAGGSIGLP